MISSAVAEEMSTSQPRLNLDRDLVDPTDLMVRWDGGMMVVDFICPPTELKFIGGEGTLTMPVGDYRRARRFILTEEGDVNFIFREGRVTGPSALDFVMTFPPVVHEQPIHASLQNAHTDLFEGRVLCLSKAFFELPVEVGPSEVAVVFRDPVDGIGDYLYIERRVLDKILTCGMDTITLQRSNTTSKDTFQEGVEYLVVLDHGKFCGKVILRSQHDYTQFEVLEYSVDDFVFRGGEQVSGSTITADPSPAIPVRDPVPDGRTNLPQKRSMGVVYQMQKYRHSEAENEVAGLPQPGSKASIPSRIIRPDFRRLN